MKQECLDCNKSLEDCTCIEDTIELPNQALIDAAERYIAGDNYNRYYDDFIEGARWQQEKSYSEEEVIKILYQFHYDLVNSNFDTKEEWFEQFKKNNKKLV
jgi:hypothetical protein